METQPGNQPYVGRFAPSPSGDLHFGSLVCALASYLDAKAFGGEWLLRIEDIDPPREQPGAKRAMLKCLERHGLFWDREVVYQSQRYHLYRDALHTLASRNLIYRCSCSRKRLSQLRNEGKNAYDRHCVYTPPPPDRAAAWRLDLNRAQQLLSGNPLNTHFEDVILGAQHYQLADQGDFVIHRKDGLHAYNLAVVVDDLAQGISHVVRGADLLSSVGPQHILASALCRALGTAPPLWRYAHIPLVTAQDGGKLSKQNRAESIDASPATNNIQRALAALRVPVPEPASIEDMLNFGIRNWQPKRLSGVSRIEYSAVPSSRHP
ncbi:MAG: tRNA glutamyl-Q(34) synthetase GluQRS [Cellvibrionaceae bacterium]|nr:tRNA glutamyl-Q(34) synthetase GluQRS [Cellvibrionaceae bacterium]